MKAFVLAWNSGIDLDSVCDRLVAALSSDTMQDRSTVFEMIERLSETSMSGNDGKWDQLSTAVDNL
jgi:hypothetical protein